MNPKPLKTHISIPAGDRELIDAWASAVVAELASTLRQSFQQPWVVTADPVVAAEDMWSQRVLVRRGSGVGVEVELSTKRRGSAIICIERSSKLDGMLFWAIVLPLTAAGAYLAFQEIGPFAWLPGRKVAAGLAGAAMFVVGSALANLLKSKRGAAHAADNAQLARQVHDLVQALPAVSNQPSDSRADDADGH